jgi:hypothetical protein
VGKNYRSGLAVAVLAPRGEGLCLLSPGAPRRGFGGPTRAFWGVKQGVVQVNGGGGGQRFPNSLPYSHKKKVSHLYGGSTSPYPLE